MVESEHHLSVCRFHALSEFDEVKRSCRKRLDGHNKRRRKSHPDLSASSSIANIQGSRFPSYMNQHNYPSVIREPGWTAGFFKSDEESVYNQQHHMMSVNRQHSFPVSSSSYHKDSNNKQFPFLQNGEIKLGNKSIETSVCQPLATTVSPLGSRSGMYSDGLISVIDSDCALSLLSSSTQSSGLSGLNNIDEIHMALPLVQGMQFNNIDRFPSDKVLTSICCSTNDIMSSGFSCTGIVDDQGPILVANTGCAEFHSPEMLQPVGNVANLVNAAVHPLHFSWH